MILLIIIIILADKVSGVAMKAPVLANALRQPFSTTGMLSLLLTKCARKAKELGSLSGDLGPLLKKCPQYQALFLIKYDSHKRIQVLLACSSVQTGDILNPTQL